MDRQGLTAAGNTTILKRYKKLVVRLSNKSDYSDVLDLEFSLIDSPFLHKWINRILHAQHRQDPISEPWAMYNLNDNWNSKFTLDFLNEQISFCNSVNANMFDRNITDISDQDTLNYLHSIFELHHGKLDTWQDNPIFAGPQGNALRQSLSHINQTVHRCEGSGGNAKIRVVYFDLPKTETFTEEDYSLFTNDVVFGGVYTLYADVGKNLESLANDNDDHHHDFVPNLHYSADFVVKFNDINGEKQYNRSKKYYKDNLSYFDSKGYSHNDCRLTTGSIKLAQLVYDDKTQLLNKLSNYDNIQSTFIQ